MTLSGNTTTARHTRNLSVRFRDLSKADYEISWVNDDYSGAEARVAKYVSSLLEKAVSKDDLARYSEQLGAYVVAWCTHNEGQKVGTGECWDLAREALAKGCGKHAFVLQYLHHGYAILEIQGLPGGVQILRGPADEIRPGDVLQFKRSRFEDRARGVTKTAGDPDHTLVVVGKRGEVIDVLEQNVGGQRVVMKGLYVLATMVSGTVLVYRPMPKEWAET